MESEGISIRIEDPEISRTLLVVPILVPCDHEPAHGRAWLASSALIYAGSSNIQPCVVVTG